MIGSDTTAAALIVVGAILIAADANEYAVYTLAILVGVAVSPFRPAQASYLPQLANSPDELAAANVAASTIESVGFLAGPALAGALLAFASISTVYIFDAATFAWSALLVLGIRGSMVAPAAETGVAAREPAESEAPAGFLAEASAGFRVIFGDRNLLIVGGLFCAQTVVMGASVVFQVAIVLGLLGLSRSGLGYVNAMLGVGGLVGGFVALVLVQRGKLARDFGFGVFLWSAPLLLVAAWPSVWTAVTMMILLGLANSIVDINGFTIIQRITPEEVMSRVFGALHSAFIAGMAVGSLLMPLLISLAGVRWGLTVVGAGVASIVLLSSAALRRIDTVALAPPGLELLRRVALLSPLPEPILDRLARALVRVEAAAGDVVIQRGGVRRSLLRGRERRRDREQGRPVRGRPRARRLRRGDRAATRRAAHSDRDGHGGHRAAGTRPRALHPGADRPERVPRRGRDGDRGAPGDALASSGVSLEDVSLRSHRAPLRPVERERRGGRLLLRRRGAAGRRRGGGARSRDGPDRDSDGARRRPRDRRRLVGGDARRLRRAGTARRESNRGSTCGSATSARRPSTSASPS